MDSIPIEAHRKIEEAVKFHLEALHEEAYDVGDQYGLNDQIFDDDVLKLIRNLICENI